MAGIVSRRPITGIAAGVIIGALGLLLLGIESPAPSVRSVATVLFKTAGCFFLFVSAVAFLGSFLAWRERRAGADGRTAGDAVCRHADANDGRPQHGQTS